MQLLKVLENSIIDGAVKIENVCSMDIVIKTKFFKNKKWVVYENYT